MELKTTQNKYEEFEALLIDNAHIWGLDNLDVIEVIANIRELTNGKLGKQFSRDAQQDK